jgi:hypothetical protein
MSQDVATEVEFFILADRLERSLSTAADTPFSFHNPLGRYSDR